MAGLIDWIKAVLTGPAPAPAPAAPETQKITVPVQPPKPELVVVEPSPLAPVAVVEPVVIEPEVVAPEPEPAADPIDVPAYLAQGKALLTEKSYEAAAKVFAAVLAVDPDNALAKESLAKSEARAHRAKVRAAAEAEKN